MVVVSPPECNTPHSCVCEWRREREGIDGLSYGCMCVCVCVCVCERERWGVDKESLREDGVGRSFIFRAACPAVDKRQRMIVLLIKNSSPVRLFWQPVPLQLRPQNNQPVTTHGRWCKSEAFLSKMRDTHPLYVNVEGKNRCYLMTRSSVVTEKLGICRSH